MAQSIEGLQLKLSSKAMEYKDKIVLAKSYVITEDENQDDIDPLQEESKAASETQLDFTTQMIIKEMTLNDLEALLILPKSEVKINFKMELVENPTHEVLMKAQVKLSNKLIFDAI